MERKTYVLGICNNNAPNLYRKYKCHDHLFYYEIEKADLDYGHMKIALLLEAFNTLLYHKLGLEIPRKYTSAAQIEEYQRIIKPEKVLQQMLRVDPLSQELKVKLKEDDKQLYLCRNYIVELNPNIRLLKNITVFQTCCNYLYHLPYGIGCLKNLKMLILSRNRLLEIPDEIGFCKELREIDVSYNLITKIPKSIIGLKKLNTLNIVGNEIKKIPSFLGKLFSLKYIGLGRNHAKLLPLELFKLPFLLNISFEINLINITKKFEEVGEITLMEIAARNIIKNNLMIPKTISTQLRKYLLSCQECSFCGGAFFDYYIEVEDYHIHDSKNFPITYRMCLKHYNIHEDRLPKLFQNNINTIPEKLHREKMPSVCELFEPFAFNQSQVKKMEEGFNIKGNKMPLISLAKYNAYPLTRFNVDMILNENFENFDNY